MIKEGKVKICLISPDGQEISLVVFGKGEYFGDLALLDGLPRSADAIALEKVECYTLQRSDFQKAIMKNPKIAIQVLEVLSKRIRSTDAMVEDLIFLDVYGRVAKKLLELSDAHGVKVEDGTRIDVRLTQQELASMVGASRESVNKVMGYFTDKGFICYFNHFHFSTLGKSDNIIEIRTICYKLIFLQAGSDETFSTVHIQFGIGNGYLLGLYGLEQFNFRFTFAAFPIFFKEVFIIGHRKVDEVVEVIFHLFDLRFQRFDRIIQFLRCRPQVAAAGIAGVVAVAGV